MRRLLGIAGVILLPTVVLADGFAFELVGASMEVRATEQRAILWLRGSVWEMHIQPVFQREPGAAAWVIPFSVRPQVAASNAEFFDQLELITSPVFVTVCVDSDSGWDLFGCGSKADMGGGEARGAEAWVRVWERGQVGELDYAILSSAQGEHLVHWLEDEGFAVPTSAVPLLEGFETEGVYFFAARVSSEADPAKPISPLRFVLPQMDPPSYPLRLTSLGVPAGQHLDLTLWVVTPKHSAFVPDSHRYRAWPDRPRTRGEYDAALDAFFTGSGADDLLVLYDLPLNARNALARRFCPDHHIVDCIPFSDLGIEAPESWCEEILQIDRSASHVQRLQARLRAGSMDRDLRLKAVHADDRMYVDNLYEHYTCSEQKANVGWVALLVVGIAGLGHCLRRRSKRHQRRVF